jgi:hypothetical protein
VSSNEIRTAQSVNPPIVCTGADVPALFVAGSACVRMLSCGLMPPADSCSIESRNSAPPTRAPRDISSLYIAQKIRLADCAVRISRLSTRRPTPKRVGGWEMYENAGNVQGGC